jgi:hypothetical protein
LSFNTAVTALREGTAVHVAKDVDQSGSVSCSKGAEDAQGAILSAVADGTVIVGTMRTLTRAWGVSTTALRSGLRELLEGDRIAVQAGSRGQLTIRLGSHAPRPLAALPPASPARRDVPKLWIV